MKKWHIEYTSDRLKPTVIESVMLMPVMKKWWEEVIGWLKCGLPIEDIESSARLWGTFKNAPIDLRIMRRIAVERKIIAGYSGDPWTVMSPDGALGEFDTFKEAACHLVEVQLTEEVMAAGPETPLWIEDNATSATIAFCEIRDIGVEFAWFGVTIDPEIDQIKTKIKKLDMLNINNTTTELIGWDPKDSTKWVGKWKNDFYDLYKYDTANLTNYVLK